MAVLTGVSLWRVQRPDEFNVRSTPPVAAAVESPTAALPELPSAAPPPPLPPAREAMRSPPTPVPGSALAPDSGRLSLDARPRQHPPLLQHPRRR